MSREAEATFRLLVLVLSMAWLSHPLIANLQSLLAKVTKAREKGVPFRKRVESRQALVHLEFCQSHRHHVQSLVLRCPRSVRQKRMCLVVGHITLLVFVLISACCVGRWDIVLQNVPTKEKRRTVFQDLDCAVFDSPCYGTAVEEIEQDQDEGNIEDFCGFFQSRVWKASQFLMEEPRRPFLDS